MKLPPLTDLVVGCIYGRVRQIRPDDEVVDLTDRAGRETVDVDLVGERATSGTTSDHAALPLR